MSRSAVLIVLVSLVCACGSLARLGVGRRIPSLDLRTRLANYLEEVHLARLDRSPETRARLGQHDGSGLWDDRSTKYGEETAQLLRADLRGLADEFGGRKLTPVGDRVRDAFARQTEALLDAHEWRLHTYAVSHLRGPHIEVPRFLAEVQPLTNADDARVYVERLHASRELFEQAVVALEQRRSAGILAPRSVLAHARTRCGALLENDDLWLDDLRTRLTALELGASAGVLADAQAALEESVRPGLTALAHTLDAHLELASADLGVWRLPRGRAYYENTVAHRAGPGWKPDDLHALGRREVERLHAELTRIAGEIGFSGSIGNFLVFLRDDAGLAWGADDYPDWSRATEVTLGSARGSLANIVANPPSTALVVRTTNAPWPGLDGVVGYAPPSADPLAPGALIVRADRATLLPRFLVAAQAHRAGLPGRHLFTTRARTRLELPKLLRFGHAAAHEEGWGLYAAALADELDSAKLPYAHAGRLAQELWCAALMVVDTGLHTRRWERRQAVEYLLRSTCYPEPLCDAAVLRCAALPGHAVSGPVGLISLRELRLRADAALGQNFEARAFHAAVLDAGPLPLDLLRAHIEDWIETRAR